MMTRKSLEEIGQYLTKLHGYAYFRPHDGALKERLTEAVLEGVDGELAETLAGASFGLEVSVGNQEGESEVSVSFSVDYPGAVYLSQIPLSILREEELQDLARYLQPMAESPAAAEEPAAAKTIVRKKHDDYADHHEIGPAAARLKVSPEWLKSVVPCTDYSYEEIEGRKYIREYYWSKELIERLFKIKCSKTTPEDLQYVATECCEGDMDWAKDLIARVKSPNRPEPAAREQQPQKGQGKGAQVRGSQQQRSQQGKGAPNRPAATPAAASAPPKPATEKAAQAAAPEGAAPAAGSGRRSRSRHRKPFRSQGKEGGPKPQPAGDQKQQ